MSQKYSKLESVFKRYDIEFKKDYPMHKLAPLKVGGNIKYIATLESEDQLKTIISEIQSLEIPYMPLGAGKNILLGDEGFDGVGIKLDGTFFSYDIHGDIVRAGAGLPMERLAREARVNGLAGLEYASSLPGSVGGCVKQDSKAFGQNTLDKIHSLRLFDCNGNIKNIDRDEVHERCEKNNAPLNGCIILSATFLLESEPEHDIIKLTEKYRYVRGLVQPVGGKTSGTIFTDTGDIKAHQMIERVGASALNYNGAHWYKRFPNYIISGAETKASDIYRLIMDSRKMVEQHFNYAPDINLVMIGYFEDGDIE